jgi:NOL1/NOP2/fmu family ribosome biogenesis protein
MKIDILSKAKKKKFVEGVSSLGLKKVPQLLIRTGKERIRAYSGNLSKEEIWDLWRVLPIEGIGLYVGKESINRNGVRETRLSIDGLHTWKEQITENVVELDEALEEEWFRGGKLELGEGNDFIKFSGKFVAVKSESSGDFIGTGKVSVDGLVLHNFLPKERRRKSQTI